MWAQPDPYALAALVVVHAPLGGQRLDQEQATAAVSVRFGGAAGHDGGAVRSTNGDVILVRFKIQG
jgi:hypothetical protein